MRARSCYSEETVPMTSCCTLGQNSLKWLRIPEYVCMYVMYVCYVRIPTRVSCTSAIVTQKWKAISGWNKMKIEIQLQGLLVGHLNFVRQDESSFLIQGHFCSCCVTYHHSGNLQDLLFWLVEAWTIPIFVLSLGLPLGFFETVLFPWKFLYTPVLC